jgi:sarcosine oxidase subunit gamma
MLERRSALAGARPYVSPMLRIAERPGFSLAQVAGRPSDMASRLAVVIGPLPDRTGQAQVNDGLTTFMIAPGQYWLVGSQSDDTALRLKDQFAVTPLSSSRVRISIEGEPSRRVLAKLMPIDFHASVFTPGCFVLTGLHHTPVLVHCTGEHAFDIYAMRTFAMTVWEVVTDAALEFAAR